MQISCIVATADNNVIGKDNDIPWYLPADLSYFKKTTINHHIIMGKNCYNSIGRPLPKRTNVILTKDPYFIVSNCLIAHSIPEALEIAYKNGEEEAFIVGGAKIYEQTVNLWDKLYLTRVDLDVEGDVYFPEVDFSEWNLISEEKHQADEKNPHDYSFLIYERAVKK
jgi:dihydrofolate reductase